MNVQLKGGILVVFPTNIDILSLIFLYVPSLYYNIYFFSTR